MVRTHYKYCSWCHKPIKIGTSYIKSDFYHPGAGQYMHLDCAKECDFKVLMAWLDVDIKVEQDYLGDEF